MGGRRPQGGLLLSKGHSASPLNKPTLFFQYSIYSYGLFTSMSYYWDRVLEDLKQSQLTGLSELFDACVSLCGKYAESVYWECVSRCHGKFNIAKVWDLG